MGNQEEAKQAVVDFAGVPKREAYMLHIESPRGVVATYTASVQRSATAAPQLEPPTVSFLDQPGTTLQGEMVGFFQQPDVDQHLH